MPQLAPSDNLACVDKLNPKTGRSDCPNMAYLCNNALYYTVMTEQCPKTCNRCGGTGTLTQYNLLQRLGRSQDGSVKLSADGQLLQGSTVCDFDATAMSKDLWILYLMLFGKNKPHFDFDEELNVVDEVVK
ncbi:shTK domain protein [Ancylostoma duodenale]|uniref:ShTK domain protein n=1 Tax=Ancylostoma duodenale TaxID=51022 RepID=A0A0C2GVL6_9BILA|nr:shTK domain protein [Ancylostoma duodenale]